MRYPTAPFLEFGFFSPEASMTASTSRLIGTLANAGMEITGEVSLYDGGYERFDPMDIDEVVHRDHLSMELRLEGDLGVGFHSPFILRTNRADCVIQIWMDGELVGYPTEALDEREACEHVAQLRRTYTDFRMLVRDVRPLYATVTVDWGIPTLKDLQRQPDALAFRTFFLGRTALDAIDTQELVAILPNAHRQVWESGEYFDLAGFRPNASSLLEGSKSQLSVEVSRILASQIPPELVSCS